MPPVQHNNEFSSPVQPDYNYDSRPVDDHYSPNSIYDQYAFNDASRPVEDQYSPYNQYNDDRRPVEDQYSPYSDDRPAIADDNYYRPVVDEGGYGRPLTDDDLYNRRISTNDIYNEKKEELSYYKPYDATKYSSPVVTDDDDDVYPSFTDGQRQGAGSAAGKRPVKRPWPTSYEDLPPVQKQEDVPLQSGGGYPSSQPPADRRNQVYNQMKMYGGPRPVNSVYRDAAYPLYGQRRFDGFSNPNDYDWNNWNSG